MTERRKRFYKRWWFRVLALLFVSFLVFDFVERRANARALIRAIEEADRLFPGDWRAEDLVAKMPPATPAADAPFAALAGWEGVDEIESLEAKKALETLKALGPAVRPNADQLSAVREKLRRAGPFLNSVERFRSTRDAFLPVDLTGDFAQLAPAHSRSIRLLAELNRLRAIVELETGDSAGAVASLSAIHHSLSWWHREPLLTSQLLRLASFHVEFELLERILGQTELPPETLRELARLIEAEPKIDPILLAVRGETAAIFRVSEKAVSGELFRELQRDNPDLRPTDSGLETWYFRRYYGARARAKVLSGLIEIRRVLEGGGSRRESDRRIGDLHVEHRHEHFENPLTYRFLWPFLPAFDKLCQSRMRFEIEARLAVAALAAERFRLERGRWPNGWEELVPGYLAAVPDDPWDDKPLRWKWTETGLLFYSCWMDRKDNGGKLDRERPGSDGSDFGFELFDPAHRRRPAPPKPVEEEDKE